MMVAPVMDCEGQLRGVVQLCNKQHGEKISEQDLSEFDCLMPALGEIFKTAEEIR
jgi:hypothetical protein